MRHPIRCGHRTEVSFFHPQVPSGYLLMVPVRWTHTCCWMEYHSVFYPFGPRWNWIHLVSHSNNKRSDGRNMWLSLLSPTGKKLCGNVTAWSWGIQWLKYAIVFIRKKKKAKLKAAQLTSICPYTIFVAKAFTAYDFALGNKLPWVS